MKFSSHHCDTWISRIMQKKTRQVCLSFCVRGGRDYSLSLVIFIRGTGQKARGDYSCLYACSFRSIRTQIGFARHLLILGSLGKSNVVSIVGCTDLLEDVLGRDGLQDVLLGRFLDLTAHQQLVQDEVRLLEVEDDVQLADLEEKGNNLES